MISNKIIFLFLAIILITISTSYSLFSQTIKVFGSVTGECEASIPDAEVVTQEDDRLTTNTQLTGGWFNVSVFTLDEEVQEGNTVITKLKNGTKTWLTPNITITFGLTIKNNSGDIYTDGKVTTTEYDPGSYITPQSATLSSKNVSSGDSTTLTAKIKFDSRSTITVGSYVNYKITYYYKGEERYYNYKIIISG